MNGGTKTWNRLAALLVSAVLLAAGGCASSTPPQSTRLTYKDYVYTVDEMADKLLHSRFLAHRGPDSPTAVITCEKVENLTLDIIPDAEEWMFMLKVHRSPQVMKVCAEKNIQFQLPPERIEMLRQSGFPEAGSGAAPANYLMSAQFMASRRASNDREGYVNKRSDYYRLAYTITDLSRNKIEWEDAVEFKHHAEGDLKN